MWEFGRYLQESNLMTLTKQRLEFLRLKGGCTGSYESTLVN